MSLKIKTNNRARPLWTFNELPAKVQPDFDYCKAKDTPFFVKVGNDFYDAFDVQGIIVGIHHSHPTGWAMYVEPDHPFAKWNGVISESYWSGKLFRFVEDDCVVVGSYHERDTPVYLCNKKRFETLEKAKVHASKVLQKTGVIVAIEEKP